DQARVLPERLRTALPPATNEQRASRGRALDDWWALHPETAAGAFAAADDVARLGDDTTWADGLATVDVAPSMERVALRRVPALLAAGPAAAAVDLARRRAGGRWSRLAAVAPSFEDGAAGRWLAVVALAEFRRDLAAYTVPGAGDSSGVLAWY